MVQILNGNYNKKNIMLKKDIRRALIETKEKKENLLIEEKIIKSRMMMIFENGSNIRNIKSLPIKKRNQISLSLIQELHYLNENELLNEDFMDILKSLFGKAFGGVIETAAEPLVNSVLTAVGFKSNGFFKKFIISFLTSRPSELIKAFGDCRTMTKLLIESFLEGIVMMIQQDMEMGGFMYDAVRNTLGGMIKEVSIVSKLEVTISGKVCEMFNKFTGKAEDVAEKLKSSQGEVAKGGEATQKTQTTQTKSEPGIFDNIKGLFN